VPAIHGYTDRISVAPGQRILFMVSADGVDRYRADIVRMVCGDTNPEGPGLKTVEVGADVNGEYQGRLQTTRPGSHIEISDPNDKLNPGSSLTIHAFVMPTLPGRGAQAIVARWSESQGAGYGLVIDEGGRLALWLGDGRGKCVRVNSDAALASGLWYSVAASYDRASGRVSLRQQPLVNAVNSTLGPASPIEPTTIATQNVGDIDTRAKVPLIIAGCAGDGASAGGSAVKAHFNGKIEAPRVYARALTVEEMAELAHDREPDRRGLIALWNFSEGIGPHGIPTDRVVEIAGSGLHGECVNMPARAMTGHNWTGREENFTHAPAQYGAIHFHDDDLADANWEPDFEWVVPAGTRSDVYAARLRGGGVERYIPFFVRPPRGTATARAAFLAPTNTYMAYANFKYAFEGAVMEAIMGTTPVVSEDDIYLERHPDFGLAMYELHSDFSGVCYSSRLRPIVNMAPNYRGIGDLWGLPADMHLIDWLNQKKFNYDVFTDEDLHAEGFELLRNYKVIITGTHPEYYSGGMLDAIETYLAHGGRVMYLGGNGFYWVTTFHPQKPWLIELRRGENGSRAWQARPGEYYHSTTGERGGLWRNRARPPQKIVGVGFTAEGFDVSSYYRRMPDSFDPRARFIFEGVGDDELIGNFGLIMGGAAGSELDRYDLSLGTPPNALLLASSENHSDNYPHVVEEIMFMYPGQGGTQDPGVRADMVYFTTRNGGGVFTSGSIAWCGSLSHNNYENNVSRITANVLARFMDDEPLK